MDLYHIKIETAILFTFKADTVEKAKAVAREAATINKYVRLTKAPESFSNQVVKVNTRLQIRSNTSRAIQEHLSFVGELP